MVRRYHHGNLREALLKAANELIAEKSPQGFTLAEAAKSAGVSAAAPYRHFASKDDLIIALATRGFETFAKALHQARKTAATPYDAIIAMSRVYLQFSQEHKGEYMAMFESGIDINSTREIATQAESALGELRLAAEAILADSTLEAKPPATIVAQHIWALSHGVAELFARGSVGRVTAFEPNDILESGLRLYLKGLGV